MKTKYFISILAGVMLFISNINAQLDNGSSGSWYWGVWHDSLYVYKGLSDGFDEDYLYKNAYIRDIPMQASVNDQGAAVVNVPLELPDVGNGLKPDLALSYNSMQFETMFGNDWGLSGLSNIRRIPKNIYYNGITKPIDEDEEIDGTEAFELNGSRLVLLENNFPVSASYQTEAGNVKVKTHFIQRQDSLTNHQLRYAYSYFEVFYPSGKTAVFGFENLAQNKSLSDFPITKISDRLGNEVNYSYIFYNEYRISKINFGKNQTASVEFFYKKTEIPYSQRTDSIECIDLFFCSYSLGPQLSLVDSRLQPEYYTFGSDCILSQIITKLDNNVTGEYKLGYHSDTKRIYLSSIQQIVMKDPTAISGDDINTISNVGLDTVPPICSSSNDNFEFSLPLRFRYGQGPVQGQISPITTKIDSLKYDYNTEISKNGTFSSKQTCGIVIYPKTDPFWHNSCPANANIVIKPDLDKLDTYTLQAGEGFLDILCTDIDGIAGDEIVKINNTYEEVIYYDEESGFTYGPDFSDILTFEVYTINVAGELVHLYTRQFPTGFERDGDRLINKQFFAGDFDGNGRNEILAVSALKTERMYDNPIKPRGELYDLENEQVVYQGFLFDNITIPSSRPPIPDPNEPLPFIDPERIIVAGNFSGNGICDLLYIPGENYNGALLEFNSGDSSLELKTLGICQGIRPIFPCDYVTADFNGDGRTDLYDIARGYVMLSDGKNFTLSYQVKVPNDFGDSFKYDGSYPEDLDGDGKSDVVFFSSTRTTACFFIDKIHVAMETRKIGFPENCRPVSGKNSHNDLVLLNGDTIVRLAYGLNFSRDMLLTGIKSGFGTVTNFEYNTIYNDSIYTQTKEMQFPYQNLDRNSVVASKMRTYNNDELLSVKTYSYENGVTHKQGLDFCGFEKITALDSIRNQSVVRTFDPLNYGILKQVESPAAKTVNTYNINIADNKIAKITLTSSVQTDKLKNTTVNKSYVYDDYGDVTKETIDFGGGIKQITENSYNNYDTETLYRLGETASSVITNYAPANDAEEVADPIDIVDPGFGDIDIPCVIDPDEPCVIDPIDPCIIDMGGISTGNNIKSTTTMGGTDDMQTLIYKDFGASISAKTDILYNDKGLPINKTSYYNSNKVSEETSAYSNVGDLLSFGIKPYSETSTLEKTYEYDGYGRVTKEKDPMNNSIEYTYDANGLLKQTKDIYGNVTEYGYDNFGRLTTTTSPLGSVTSVKYQWIDAETTCDAPVGVVYSVTTKTHNDMNNETDPGEMVALNTKTISYGEFGDNETGDEIAIEMGQTIAPETTSYFDALGREIRSEQARFDGSMLKIDKKYDARGRLWKVSAPYKSESPTLWDVYSYDDFDRPTSILYASGKKDTWTYSENTVTSKTDGIETTKTYNAAGQLIKVADAGGTITYAYRPDGKPEKIVTNGATTSFTYDNYGRQLTITDPSAGTETVTYDSRGNIASRKDAKNQTTTFLYDNFYRLTAKQMPEYTVNYGYNAKNGLTGINSNGGQSIINYTFDNYGRLTGESETFEGKTLAKKYAYSDELLASKTYTLDNNTVTTETLIYQNGYHTETKITGNKSIWKITAENEQGQTTTATTGNFTRTYGFDAFGMPTTRKIQLGNTVIQNFVYNFDASTGNLLSRKDNTRGITENFGYDNLNRLVNFGGSSAVYAGNGNISEKNDMLYSYYTNRPYAVSEIDAGAADDPNLVPSGTQTIKYTSFKRPASIESNDTVYQFAYNGLDMRTKMFLSADTGKIYLGDCYEKDQTGGNTKEKLYLCDDYYTSPAVMVRENNGAWQLYYIGRDYLGSITNVVSESGNESYEYSYDAWGNLRNPDTQALYAQDEQPNLFLGRGFTGHEHLPFCNLINMNARLYDPAVGRFLSSDPYVQSSDFTQSYNRYSYAWNNPLRYTDPTGEKSYRYNEWTFQYEDENGNWASWIDVYRWMNDNNMFKSFDETVTWISNSFSWENVSGGYNGTGLGNAGVGNGWGNVGDGWKPHTLYINNNTQQIRFIVPNSGIMGTILQTINVSGNVPNFGNGGFNLLDGIGMSWDGYSAAANQIMKGSVTAVNELQAVSNTYSLGLKYADELAKVTKWGNAVKWTGWIGTGVIGIAHITVGAAQDGWSYGYNAQKATVSAAGGIGGAALGAWMGGIIGTFFCPGPGTIAGAAMGSMIVGYFGGNAGGEIYDDFVK